jgi:hypothetical protein
MSTTPDQFVEEISWEVLRQRATQLNVPAWQLAEDSAFHIRNGDLVMGGKKKKRQAAVH